MTKKSFLYEINTRVWLHHFDDNDHDATLADVPEAYWKSLAARGYDAVWLMGVWEITESIIPECSFEPALVNQYEKALKDWRREDVIGSPFAINKYSVNPKVGTEEDLTNLKEHLNSIGMKLILDFVPNHLSAHSEILGEHPEYFLQGTKEDILDDSYTFFRSKYHENKIFAHGRDPFFPAWTDTVQLNLYCPETREFLTNTLLEIAEKCDGVRCDMAILVLNNVFGNTWQGIIDSSKHPHPEKEFWETAINTVKEKHSDFIFIGEAYWDLEWQLQQLGFDYTYDKKLYDRLRNDPPPRIKEHLFADEKYQHKSVRFIENHDEDRAMTAFGHEKSLAAAVIVSTLQGMTLFYEGQTTGKKIKLPVQIGREPEEILSKSVEEFYKRLLESVSQEIFKSGEWNLLDTSQSSSGNYTFENIIAWMWRKGNEYRVVVVNYSQQSAQCRIRINLSETDYELDLFDELNDKKYNRTTAGIASEGLYIDLTAFQSHIFSFTIPGE